MTGPGWVYPYQSDPTGKEQALRPVARVVVGGDTAARPAMADTGSDHTIISPGLAAELELDFDTSQPLKLAFAGPGQLVYPAPVSLTLLPPPGAGREPVTWETEAVVATEWVAWFDVLLGQQGFFDVFTVTFSAHARAFAVEPTEAFDERFEAPTVDLGGGPAPPRMVP